MAHARRCGVRGRASRGRPRAPARGSAAGADGSARPVAPTPGRAATAPRAAGLDRRAGRRRRESRATDAGTGTRRIAAARRRRRPSVLDEARPAPAAVGVLGARRTRGRSGRVPAQDPPLPRRRRARRPAVRGALRHRARRSAGEGGHRARVQRVVPVARRDGRQHGSVRGRRARTGAPPRRCARRRGGRSRSHPGVRRPRERHVAVPRAADVVEPRPHRPPGGRVRLGGTGRRAHGQGGVRSDGERRRARDVRRCAAALPR